MVSQSDTGFCKGAFVTMSVGAVIPEDDYSISQDNSIGWNLGKYFSPHFDLSAAMGAAQFGAGKV
jgi:hypothetical protein